MNEEEKNKTQKEYRYKCPNCKWCIWFKYHSPRTIDPFLDCADYITCELKDKMIYFPKLKAKFCKYYYIEEEK